MKKAIILVTLVVAMASPAAAQQGTSFGARVGVNFASLSFDPDEGVEASGRTAMVVGGFATIPITPRFAFQPELLFSQQGATTDDDEFGGEAAIKLNYINIPLLANIGLSDGPTRVALLVGPQIGFRTSAKLEAAFEGEDDEEFDLDDETESTDFALVAGVAAYIRNFVIDARYTHGLRNINALEDDDQSIKNRVFTISVGISFR